MPGPRRRRHHAAGFDAATVKLWDSRTASTTARAVRALHANGKPICDGGLAPYFVSEAHRRAAQEPRTAATPYAALAIAAIPASHRGRGDLEERCSVCLDGGKSADPEETLTLMCKFHRRCILRWLAVTIVCPYCRAQVASLEPYRYPARTVLRSTFLRERIDHIVDWQQVFFKTRLPTAMLAWLRTQLVSAVPLGVSVQLNPCVLRGISGYRHRRALITPFAPVIINGCFFFHLKLCWGSGLKHRI